MPDRLPAGPYRTVSLPDGSQFPFYIIPFDKEGRCEAPETRRHLVDDLRNGGYTNVFLFSHGWNNDWTVATGRYEDFLRGYTNMRRQHGLAAPQGYKPLLVGVFWPSTAMAFGEKEKGPAMAAADSRAMDAQVAEERAQIRELAASIPGQRAERFYALAQKDKVDEGEARELAGLLIGNARSGNDELGVTDAPTPEEIVKVAQAASAADQPKAAARFGTVGGAAQPQAAGGLFSKLDPRHILRTFTVWQMKDRAGTVGAHGVGPLLRDLLGATQAPFHLIGHSYGAKVVLSAVTHGPELSRKVESMLLLQPAVSHLCFAAKVPQIDRPGGYRPALERVAKPIFATFSKHDVPLHDTFHLALRREEDLGEMKIAADGEPPSKYAALGGYGPRGAGEEIVPVCDVGQAYNMDLGARVYGIEAHRTISGHGEISNESTYWALYCQTK